MRSFTNDEVIAKLRYHQQCARDSSKEGRGTGRGAGMAGRAAAEWMMWRTEAVKRGLTLPEALARSQADYPATIKHLGGL